MRQVESYFLRKELGISHAMPKGQRTVKSLRAEMRISEQKMRIYGRAISFFLYNTCSASHVFDYFSQSKDFLKVIMEGSVLLKEYGNRRTCRNSV